MPGFQAVNGCPCLLPSTRRHRRWFPPLSASRRRLPLNLVTPDFEMIKHSCKHVIAGGVCDWGQWVGNTLSPWGLALPVGALALHRSITFVSNPKCPSLGSLWDLAPLLGAAVCQEVAVGGQSHLGTLPGLDTPCPLGSQCYQFSLCQGCGWGGWAGSSHPGLGCR